MKFKKIVGFGDSWVWGDELLDPTLASRSDAHPVLIENTAYRESCCFLGLLGDHYGIPAENFGIPGGSLQSTLWTYLWWLENEKLNIEDCLVVVGHTSADRVSFYNPNHISYENDPSWNRYVHGAWIHSGATGIKQDWVDMFKSYTVLTTSHSLSKLNYKQTVRFFEGQWALNNNLLQVCTLPPPAVVLAKNLPEPTSCLANLINHDPKYLANKMHPNESGHQVIRDHLINQIESVILA